MIYTTRYVARVRLTFPFVPCYALLSKLFLPFSFLSAGISHTGSTLMKFSLSKWFREQFHGCMYTQIDTVEAYTSVIWHRYWWEDNWKRKTCVIRDERFKREKKILKIFPQKLLQIFSTKISVYIYSRSYDNNILKFFCYNWMKTGYLYPDL